MVVACSSVCVSEPVLSGYWVCSIWFCLDVLVTLCLGCPSFSSRMISFIIDIVSILLWMTLVCHMRSFSFKTIILVDTSIVNTIIPKYRWYRFSLVNCRPFRETSSQALLLHWSWLHHKPCG